jgi:hypothetical protein
MQASLTLAIPTFNRSLDAARLAGQIASWTQSGDGAVSAVFYDDGSTDNTSTVLQKYRSDHLEVIRSDTNNGYAKTLIRALSEYDTEWVMMVADDDVFAPKPGQLEELVAWLHAEDPDFVCTQWLTSDGRLYRGKKSIRPISDESLRQATSHAPGLIYRASSVRPALPMLDRELGRKSDAALVYPQVVLVAQMLAAGCKAMYWPGSIVCEGSGQPSGIRDVQGRKYWSAKSRLAQAFAFDRTYREMERQAPSRQYRRHCRNFRKDNDARLAKALHRILRPCFPEDMSQDEIFATIARSSGGMLGR